MGNVQHTLPYSSLFWRFFLCLWFVVCTTSRIGFLFILFSFSIAQSKSKPIDPYRYVYAVVRWTCKHNAIDNFSTRIFQTRQKIVLFTKKVIETGNILFIFCFSELIGLLLLSFSRFFIFWCFAKFKRILTIFLHSF